METPCYCCEKRKLGCHGNCQDYKAFREWVEETRKNYIHRERCYVIYGE